MGWHEAGAAWGAQARDWAYLMEPYARPANDRLFDELGVTVGVRLLDVACGSGYAVAGAAARGAAISGLDASTELIAIAGARNPAADLRVGDMFALPFPDRSFDVVSSFNGIWAGCEPALREARRVLVPGGRLGMTFWGRPANLGLLPYFVTVAKLSPPSHARATMTQGRTGRPGVVESMIEAAGLEVAIRGAVTVTAEWPDLDLAVRALSAAGPSFPAIEHVGRQRFADELAQVLAPLVDPRWGLRLVNEFGYITATNP